MMLQIFSFYGSCWKRRVSVFSNCPAPVYLVFLVTSDLAFPWLFVISYLGYKSQHARRLGGSKQVMGLIMAGDSASKLILSQWTTLTGPKVHEQNEKWQQNTGGNDANFPNTNITHYMIALLLLWKCAWHIQYHYVMVWITLWKPLAFPVIILAHE